MAHNKKVENELVKFIQDCAAMTLSCLAQQHLVCGETLLETEDTPSARATRALIACIDAIGKVKFPREWEAARDNAGLNQEA